MYSSDLLDAHLCLNRINVLRIVNSGRKDNAIFRFDKNVSTHNS